MWSSLVFPLSVLTLKTRTATSLGLIFFEQPAFIMEHEVYLIKRKYYDQSVRQNLGNYLYINSQRINFRVVFCMKSKNIMNKRRLSKYILYILTNNRVLIDN